MLSDAQAVARLKVALAGNRSARAWALENGLSYTHVMDVKDGRRNMSPAVAGALGLKRVHGWTEKGEK